MLKKLWKIVQVFVFLYGSYVIVADAILNQGFSIGEVSGESMEPTFHDMDKVLIRKYPLLYRTPRKGEVVVVYDLHDKDYIIKRIGAIPGEVVILNGKTVNLNKNQYVVIGDNSELSYDSRYYGPVHLKQIIGIVDE